MKNILLLSMSTLPNNLKINRYTHTCGETYIYGISQLEPITKFLLTAKNIELDRVVIMASADALKPHKDYQISACNFYLSRIFDYLLDSNKQKTEDELNEKNSKDFVNDAKQNLNILEKYKCHSNCENIKYRLGTIEFVIVPMKNEQISFFFNVIEQVQFNEGTRLYIDMQGGDRNAIVQMNAIVGLLEGKDVEIAGRYAIEFQDGKIENPIKEVSSAYKTYELISAMQAFKKYGRGQSLIDYFGKNNDKKIEDLLEAIKKASASIRLCDIDGFDKALCKIADLRPSFETNTAKTELDIVFKDIVDDYGEMLSNTKGGYLRKIEWCIKKGYIQQALTIVESKMPDYLYAKEVVQINMNEIRTINGIEEKISDWLNADEHKKKLQSVEHLAIENLFYNNYERDNDIEIINGCSNAQQLLNNYRSTYINWIKLRKPNYLKIKPTIKSGCIRYMLAFMKLHYYLKDQRNIVNHGSVEYERRSLSDLSRKLEIYVELGKKLIQE